MLSTKSQDHQPNRLRCRLVTAMVEVVTPRSAILGAIQGSVTRVRLANGQTPTTERTEGQTPPVPEKAKVRERGKVMLHLVPKGPR